MCVYLYYRLSRNGQLVRNNKMRMLKMLCAAKRLGGLSGFLIRRSSARLKQLVRNYVLIPWLALLHGRFLATVAIMMFKYTMAKYIYMYMYTRFIYIYIYVSIWNLYSGVQQKQLPEKIRSWYQFSGMYIHTFSGSNPNATPNLSFQAACHHSVPGPVFQRPNQWPFFGWWSSRSGISCIGDTDRQYQCGCFQK